MKQDINDIKNSDKVLLGADKTTNFYKIKPEAYEKLLTENITKEYKKAKPDTIQNLDKEDKIIADKLEIANRMYKLTKREAHITIKDHKEDFRNNPKCRLINPTKSEIGKVSRQLLRAKIEVIKNITKLDSLKDSNCAKKWYTDLRQKHNLTFIQWDSINFYPSITRELLEKSIEWAKQYVDFSQEDIEFIMQARKAVLIHNNKPWTKKTGDSFDVTVGSDDGAEVCELVGLYILSLLVHLTYGKAALYRDDGAMAVRGSPRQTETKTKEVASIMKSTGIGITIAGNPRPYF